MTEQNPILSVEGLCVGFRTAAGFADTVHDVSFSIGHRKTLCIVGESGSGKSVTCQAILGLLAGNGAQTGGRILFEGHDLGAMSETELEAIRGRGIGMVFQDPLGSLNPVHTVGRLLDEALLLHTQLNRSDRHVRSIELLRLVRIPDPEQRLKAYVHQFSGGMAQRVMIAIALACRPQLLIADEPTTALDVTIQAQILELLNHLKSELGMSLLFITHDLGVVAEMADDVVVMRHGRVVEAGPLTQVFNTPASDYTKSLLDAVARLDTPSPAYRWRDVS
ncbi:ATP-binding cassette domain-containing protein [Microvirga puerhi]|uniref:ABC transporter ATP-binding protein n=1 Tax=Microvirga puerhi TaxID=2876078 RepID=A0ABS7VT04_9HYPH|nr:ABC transporter ATP-binding protein [Microvirga puerhi]MBZ6078680.1 ABC transporter ATP-binding protein [Microvirga puerhi]